MNAVGRSQESRQFTPTTPTNLGENFQGKDVRPRMSRTKRRFLIFTAVAAPVAVVALADCGGNPLKVNPVDNQGGNGGNVGNGKLGNPNVAPTATPDFLQQLEKADYKTWLILSDPSTLTDQQKRDRTTDINNLVDLDLKHTVPKADKDLVGPMNIPDYTFGVDKTAQSTGFGHVTRGVTPQISEMRGGYAYDALALDKNGNITTNVDQATAALFIEPMNKNDVKGAWFGFVASPADPTTINEFGFAVGRPQIKGTIGTPSKYADIMVNSAGANPVDSRVVELEFAISGMNNNGVTQPEINHNKAFLAFVANPQAYLRDHKGIPPKGVILSKDMQNADAFKAALKVAVATPIGYRIIRDF